MNAGYEVERDRLATLALRKCVDVVHGDVDTEWERERARLDVIAIARDLMNGTLWG